MSASNNPPQAPDYLRNTTSRDSVNHLNSNGTRRVHSASKSPGSSTGTRRARSSPKTPDLPISLPEPITVSKKVKSHMDYLARKHPMFYEYAGHTLIGQLFYMYLLNKYNSNCLIYDQTYGYFEIGLIIHIKDGLESKQDTHFNIIATDIAKCIANNNPEVIIIPLGLKFDGHSHANMLIYRRALNTIEHYEPHGAFYQTRINHPENIRIMQELKKFITILKSKIPDIRFVPSSTVCINLNGLQSLEQRKGKHKKEGGGYCMAWSMFFAELSLKNPSISSKALLETILNHVHETKMNRYLTKVIQGYAYSMQDKLEKYYAIAFEQQMLYHKILEGDKTFIQEIKKRMNIITYIEILLTNNPVYAKTVPRELMERRLAERFWDDSELAIEIYNKLVAAKNDMSPVRDLMDDSPSATSKSAKRNNPP